MDIEDSDYANEESFDIQPVQKNTEKRLELSNQAQSAAFSIHKRRTKVGLFNRAIDPNNTGQKLPLSLRTKQFGSFRHFFTKNKNRDSRLEVLDVLRQLAQERGIKLNGRIKDRLEKSTMILRVLAKEDTSGIVTIEDQTGKEKMQVKNGTVWIGMIACMEVSWADGSYRLERLNDLSFSETNQRSVLKEPAQSYRILFVKGSFSPNDSKQNLGIKVLTNQLKLLKEKERIRIDTVVIFGPLYNSKNVAMTNGFSQLTFEEQSQKLVKLIQDQIKQINSEMQIVFVPSTDDLINIYPIPQPSYNFQGQDLKELQRLHFTSNPGVLHLSGRQTYNINLINYDILQYIDETRTGRANGQLLQENLQAYFKQPFFMTNTLDEPFDQTNLSGLYNSGKFGQIVVTSSHRDPPFAREIRGKLYINIGSLGIDKPNVMESHFMTLVTIFEGEGAASGRIKVQSLTM